MVLVYFRYVFKYRLTLLCSISTESERSKQSLNAAAENRKTQPEKKNRYYLEIEGAGSLARNGLEHSLYGFKIVSE